MGADHWILGLEFADLLAAQKVNLVLAARRLPTKLDSTRSVVTHALVGVYLVLQIPSEKTMGSALTNR
jgi:short-subunit dehydrogenase